MTKAFYFYFLNVMMAAVMSLQFDIIDIFTEIFGPLINRFTEQLAREMKNNDR